MPRDLKYSIIASDLLSLWNLTAFGGGGACHVGIELFERAADADQAMLTDPDLDAVSSEDQRSLLELIEDEILLELGHGLTHADCRPEFDHETGRLSPFKDLAKLMAMKKP